MSDLDYDVIVVGGGGSGMTAALFAHEAGAKVLILEADKKLGGATALSDGVVYAAGTRVQKDLGIVDSPKDMFDYVMTLNAWQTRPDIIRALAERSAATVEWLISSVVSTNGRSSPESMSCRADTARWVAARALGGL